MSEPTVPPPPSYNPPPPPPPSSGGPGPAGPGSVSPNRTLMIVLSYLGIFALIPLLAEKEDREVQWHAKHGLVLTVAWIALSFIIGILGGMLAFVDIGCTGCVLQWILMVVILIVHIMAIMKGLNGQRLIIPGLSDFANRF
ncbi:MAG TPA: DUF4870 domain-containing protein [Thermoanaerobaculia bacterium]|nr:DUF4870 domain-containing protein [Thermoanaerobaculia bacterium]